MKREVNAAYFALIMAAIIVLAGGPINTAFGSSSYTFTKITAQDDLTNYGGAINDHDQIVGSYRDWDGAIWKVYGFLYSPSQGKLTTLDYPGAKWTAPSAINDNGQIIGGYLINWPFRSFVYSSGTFHSIDVPGARTTTVSGINNQGDIVGSYEDGNGKSHGFILRFILGQTVLLRTIDYPSAVETFAAHVNNQGDIVGYYVDKSNVYHGWITHHLSTEKFNTIDFPQAKYTAPSGINDKGQIIGQYSYNSTGFDHSCFMYSKGAFKPIKTAGDDGPSYCTSINNYGEVVGNYYKGDVSHGFLFAQGRFHTFHSYGNHVTTLYGINNHGDIAGVFDQTGFLATKNDES